MWPSEAELTATSSVFGQPLCLPCLTPAEYLAYLELTEQRLRDRSTRGSAHDALLVEAHRVLCDEIVRVRTVCHQAA